MCKALKELMNDIFPERGAQKLGISVEQLKVDMDARASGF